jgi:hypothetical protein
MANRLFNYWREETASIAPELGRDSRLFGVTIKAVHVNEVFPADSDAYFRNLKFVNGGSEEGYGTRWNIAESSGKLLY